MCAANGRAQADPACGSPLPPANVEAGAVPFSPERVKELVAVLEVSLRSRRSNGG